eukprot:CAMPEP_0172774864 /NCGR_PEP_ID=MMETSP1074-20121228/196953_1 /TAXON_ID=2916 /ORGANISM="Ceratium fusus, Strain PA161109" /LENGTH=221 /DNA_ID=CAMNT_0013611371 /DNA_START=52 /DNA_END=715 /DNA_ORIENTATION=+
MREDWPDPRALRDSQVFPRHVREMGDHQQIHRTAAIKNSTRGMTERPDMRTTYQHDFGIETRSKPRSSSLVVPSSSDETQRLPSGSHQGSKRGSSSGHRQTSTPWSQPGRTPQFSTPRSGTHDALSITVRGWGDTVWDPKQHPLMNLGFANKHHHLMQTAKICRAADLPYPQGEAHLGCVGCVSASSALEDPNCRPFFITMLPPDATFPIKRVATTANAAA